MRLLYFLVSLLILVTVCLPLAHAEIVRDGLVASWSFDASTVVGEIARDLQGNYDATIRGNPETVPGKYNEAIQFDGTDDYLELTILEGVGSHLGNFSIDFWLKTDITPDWTTLFKTLTDGLSMAWAVDLNRTAKPNWAYVAENTHFYIRDETGKALAPEIQAPIYDNTWHHIAWVVEDAQTNTCRIYVDGEEQDIIYAKVETPVGFIDFQHPMYLGAANNRGNIERFCPASVDEFRIYTRALTEQEILQNMGSGAAVESVGKLTTTWGNVKDQ
jgi:hypothetical protein